MVSARAAAVLALWWAAGCQVGSLGGRDKGGGADDAGIDAAGVTDGGAADTGTKVSTLPCEQLREAWMNFVDDHSRCASARDCVVVAGTGSCACAATLGAGGGDAIARPALDRAMPYLDRFEVCRDFFRDAYGEVCGTAPAKGVRCRSNQCETITRACATDGGRDGGSIADGGTDAVDAGAVPDGGAEIVDAGTVPDGGDG